MKAWPLICAVWVTGTLTYRIAGNRLLGALGALSRAIWAWLTTPERCMVCERPATLTPLDAGPSGVCDDHQELNR